LNHEKSVENHGSGSLFNKVQNLEVSDTTGDTTENKSW